MLGWFMSKTSTATSPPREGEPAGIHWGWIRPLAVIWRPSRSSEHTYQVFEYLSFRGKAHAGHVRSDGGFQVLTTGHTSCHVDTFQPMAPRFSRWKCRWAILGSEARTSCKKCVLLAFGSFNTLTMAINWKTWHNRDRLPGVVLTSRIFSSVL